MSLEIEGLKTNKHKLALKLQKALKEAFTDLEVEINQIIISYPDNSNFGDYSCPIALSLSKKLGQSPRDIAQKIADNIEKGDFISKLEIAGPGFINFFLSEKYYQNELQKILDQKAEYPQVDSKKETIIVEYSQPNIAKPLGVHHLLSTIIGQSIRNILEKLGYNCISINYLGDWGTQFGKLIYAYKTWGDKQIIEKDPINELLKLYVKFHDEAEKKEELEDLGRAEFKKFEEGDQENREIWKWFLDESIKEINKVYQKLGGIKFDSYQGESFVEPFVEGLLKEGKEKGIFVEGEEGSYIVEFEDENMPVYLVQKKDGATLYSTRDLATVKYRIENYKPHKILYVVDVAQSLHFKQFFEAASRFDWYGGEGEHVVFGRMSMKDKKMSTRKGNVILLDDVLDESISRAEEALKERFSSREDDGSKESEVNIKNLAHQIGVSALKYNVLSQNRTSNIVFDWDKMLSFEGNSSPYLQYTFARALSVLRKAKNENSVVKSKDASDKEIELEQQKEEKLLKFFTKYLEFLELAGEEYKPNTLATYLYELAQTFNNFYNGVPILSAANQEQKEFRIKLVKATSIILRNGLTLLGLEAPEKM